ncbi:MAG: hypothetical protein KJN92_09695 [Gemmatimonadetes bacterium]|nr:hypothetical protein [Gemmatimonadota bacterium]
MGARISKFMPITGLSLDLHKALPPIVPPPAPPLPAIPMHPWIAVSGNPASGHFLTGKWSQVSVQTEGMGDILHTYDWGPGQAHVPLPPVVASPTMALLLLTSSTKYWLPAFSVQERQDGVFPGGAKPIAVSTPAYFICTQHCSEPIPSLAGVCFQLVSTRWCAFTIGDLLAGAIGVVADAVVGAITNRAGSMIPGDAVGRAVANAVLGHALNYAVGALDAAGGEGAPAGALGKFVRTLAGAAALGAGNSQVAASLLAPLVGDVAELGSNAVGESQRVQPPSGSGGSGSSSPSGSGGGTGSGSN